MSCKMGRKVGAREMLILFFVGASDTLFFLFFLALQNEIRFPIEGWPFIKTTYGKRLLLFLGTNFIGSSLVNVWLQTLESASRELHTGQMMSPFSPPRPSPSTWLPATFQSHLHVAQGVFCDQHKEVKTDPQRMARAYRNRHQGSQP